MPIIVNYTLLDDGAVAALESLLAIVQRRVDLRAQVRDFLDQFPTIAVGQIEHRVAAPAGEPVARLQCGKDLEVFLAALRANERNGAPLDRGDEGAGKPGSEG